jgi:quinoprotein glucose dehydrogenase
MFYRCVCLIAVFLPVLYGQSSKSTIGDAADWPLFNRDLGGTRYSPLTQINTKTVARLTSAWTFRLRTPAEQDRAFGGNGISEGSPLVVKGVMYLTAGKRVVALEPETGKIVWEYESANGIPSIRGVAYWPGDQNNPPRVIFTIGRRMLALNANTGKSDPGFGKEGEVDLVVPYSSPPTVYKNLLFVGANVQELPATGPAGDTRAYDARTGAKVWEFHSVPRPGETGHETWSGEEWKDRSGANNWGFYMTVDAERGILYTTLGSVSSDFYGADRKGDNLFGSSLVALDANTGKLKWHFQVVHHDIWDMDLPPGPVLLDITRNGKKIPILAQSGKTGYLYILDRVTGKPIFGINEVPVPQSGVPGEVTAPTQPVPVKPPPIGRHSFTLADLVTAEDTTEAHAKACRDLAERSGLQSNQGPYTPWVYRAPGAPPVTTVNFPGSRGGVDWGGVSADPKLGYVFLNTQDWGSLGWIEKMPADSRVPYDLRSIYGTSYFSKFWDKKVDEKGAILGEQSWPCQKPPWGQMTAVNARTGEIAWQVPLGVTDELPAAKRNTGRLNSGGSIATAGGLVFIAATNDHRFRAFDSRTGKVVWETRLEYVARSVPITYRGRNGKQYVAIIGAGEGTIANPNPLGNESVYVFALP